MVTNFANRLRTSQVPQYSGLLKVNLAGSLPGLLMATLGLLAIQSVAAGEPWNAPLAGGGQVQVDPRTHQPIISRDGHQTQLWNGVHRLEDGSVILVQDGRVVPRQDMRNPPPPTAGVDGTTPTVPSAPTGPAGPTATSLTPPNSLHTAPLVGTVPCEQLVAKVCGQVIECWGKPACAAARQLRAMDHEELLAGANPAQGTQTGQQCQDALNNGYFSACGLAPPAP